VLAGRVRAASEDILKTENQEIKGTVRDVQVFNEQASSDCNRVWILFGAGSMGGEY
jgi:hypothetical protein